MPEEKARWELHKDAVCYFKQILIAAHQKIITVQPLTSNHKNCQLKPTRHAGHFWWWSKDKLIRDILCTPTHGHYRGRWPTKTHSLLLCGNSIPFRGFANSDRWQELNQGSHTGSTLWQWRWEYSICAPFYFESVDLPNFWDEIEVLYLFLIFGLNSDNFEAKEFFAEY